MKQKLYLLLLIQNPISLHVYHELQVDPKCQQEFIEKDRNPKKRSFLIYSRSIIKFFYKSLLFPSSLITIAEFAMQRKPKNMEKQEPNKQIDLEPEIRLLLSSEYLCAFPATVSSFYQLLQIATQALQQNIFRLKTCLTSQHIHRYGIKNIRKNECPFPPEQVKLLNQICELAQTIFRKRDYHTTTESLKQLNSLLHSQCHHLSLRDQKQQEILKIQQIPYPKLQIKKQTQFHSQQLEIFQKEQNNLLYTQAKMKIHLLSTFNQFQLNFKYINIKEAILFQSLRRCQIWFTICRERKKSGKGFYLDPLINTFDSISNKSGIIGNPFHISVLPRRNVKTIQQKKNVEKAKNVLFQAVANRKYEQVKKLILKGADIEAPAFGNQRMARQMKCAHKAAENNDLKMCKILTSFGVDWQSLDSELMTPIFYTVQGRCKEVLKYLVEEIHVNIEHREIQNRTPFYWACTQGEIEYITYLYSLGADINSKSKLGRCPLSKACFLGRTDIVEFLLSCKEIDILSKDEKGRTALHNATFGPKGGREGQKFGTNDSDSPQCAQMLLQKGFPVDELDFQRNTALHIAASSEAINSIPLLMAYGASLTARNDYGETPLLTAAKFGHIQTVKILYENYNSSILTKDVFGKNIILLVTKFRQFKQNTHKHFPAEGTVAEKTQFRKKNTSVNPVFDYILDKFIYEAYLKFQQEQYSSSKYEKEKQESYKELEQTFLELMKHAVHEEFMTFTEKLIEFKVPFPELTLKDVKTLLDMELSFNGERQRKVVLSILHSKNKQGFHVFQLEKQAIVEFITWLIRKNSISLLQFLADNQLLVFYHFNENEHQQEKVTRYTLPMGILASSIGLLKQKIITFCLLNLNFNWIDFIDEQTGGNIFHLLVKSRKVGTLIQLTKLLGGKKMNFIKNRYVLRLLEQEHVAEQHHKKDYKFKQSPIDRLFMSLLSQKDNDGITPYQLAYIVKENSIIKILSQRLKQQSIEKGNGALQKLEVKQYKIIKEEQNLQELKVFEQGHEAEEQLEKFIAQIQFCQTKQELAQYMKILAKDTKQLGENVNIETDVELQWNNFSKRPLHIIKTEQDIPVLKALLAGPKAVGIDVEYDFADGNQTIICILQFSSLQEDFIVDMMSCTFERGENRYVPFIKKLKEEFFVQFCYDQSITKLMHGSDHDLYILKSCFNCSFVNFLDSSRVDIDLRRIKDGPNTPEDLPDTTEVTYKKYKFSTTDSKFNKVLCVRGLATLVKQYLNIPMSKDHQVSQWKIRPIPTTMIEYARRDSMIMPFLVHRQLSLFDKLQDLKKSIINGLRMAKKNKKPQQPLIKKLIPI